MKSAVVFMHGLGDSPAGWSSLEGDLGRKLAPRNIVWRFPAAPEAPVTINNGAVMTSWMDILDWPIGLTARDDKAGLERSVAEAHAVMDGLVAEGVPAERIVVGGFSQGGAIALLATSRYGQKLAGCVCLSGWLTLREEYTNPANKATPVFWGHGSRDGIVLPEQQAEGVKVLAANGVAAVTAKQYQVEHSSHPQEMADMLAFLKEAIPE
eukprot:SAG22_NODE_5411_length_1019_cov_2.369565_1_plen_210_part_00